MTQISFHQIAVMYTSKMWSTELKPPFYTDCNGAFVGGLRVDDDGCVKIYCGDLCFSLDY